MFQDLFDEILFAIRENKLRYFSIFAGTLVFLGASGYFYTNYEPKEDIATENNSNNEGYVINNSNKVGTKIDKEAVINKTVDTNIENSIALSNQKNIPNNKNIDNNTINYLKGTAEIDLNDNTNSNNFNIDKNKINVDITQDINPINSDTEKIEITKIDDIINNEKIIEPYKPNLIDKIVSKVLDKYKRNDNSNTGTGDINDNTTTGNKTEDTTTGGTNEDTTTGDTTEDITNGDTNDDTTNGDITEDSTNGDTNDETTNGDIIEDTTNGDTIDNTTTGDNTDDTTDETNGNTTTGTTPDEIEEYFNNNAYYNLGGGVLKKAKMLVDFKETPIYPTPLVCPNGYYKLGTYSNIISFSTIRLPFSNPLNILELSNEYIPDFEGTSYYYKIFNVNGVKNGSVTYKTSTPDKTFYWVFTICIEN